MGKLNPYGKYKDSRVPWLEHVPEHWKVLRLGSQFVERKQKVSDKDFAPLSVTKKGILPQLESAAKSNDGDNRKKVCSGDFVINSRSDRKGSSGVSPHTGSVSLINTVLTPISIEERYVHHIFRSNSFQEEFYRVGRGIVADLWSTKFADMRSIMIPVPPQDEQQQISRYLDWQTSKINKFIKNKKGLISLLREQKQNLINRAVTVGLNPNSTMKDSEVEWIGQIPKHWSVRKLKSLSKINSGQVDPKTEEFNEMILIAPNHIESKTGKLLFTESAYEQGAISAKCFVRKGQLLYSKIGPALRKATIAPYDCICSADMYGITFDQKTISNEFALISILSDYFSKYVADCTRGVAMPRINLEAFGAAWMTIPPLDEQAEIVKFIQDETSIIDQAIIKAERENEYIQEYRTRLVSDVVTGKVNVRSVEIPEFQSVDADLEVQDDEESEDELITETIAE